MERARAVGEQSKYHSHKQPLASQSGDFVGPDTPQTDGHALPASSSQTNSPEFRALLLHHIQTFQNGRNASTLILAQLRSGLSGLSGTVCSGIFVLLWLCASMDPCDVKSFNPCIQDRMESIFTSAEARNSRKDKSATMDVSRKPSTIRYRISFYRPSSSRTFTCIIHSFYKHDGSNLLSCVYTSSRGSLEAGTSSLGWQPPRRGRRNRERCPRQGFQYVSPSAAQLSAI
jgi:hypothetical protein